MSTEEWNVLVVNTCSKEADLGRPSTHAQTYRAEKNVASVKAIFLTVSPCSLINQTPNFVPETMLTGYNCKLEQFWPQITLQCHALLILSAKKKKQAEKFVLTLTICHHFLNDSFRVIVTRNVRKTKQEFFILLSIFLIVSSSNTPQLICSGMIVCEVGIDLFPNIICIYKFLIIWTTNYSAYIIINRDLTNFLPKLIFVTVLGKQEYPLMSASKVFLLLNSNNLTSCCSNLLGAVQKQTGFMKTKFVSSRSSLLYYWSSGLQTSSW